jgi:hypothetical protein
LSVVLLYSGPGALGYVEFIFGPAADGERMGAEYGAPGALGCVAFVPFAASQSATIGSSPLNGDAPSPRWNGRPGVSSKVARQMGANVGLFSDGHLVQSYCICAFISIIMFHSGYRPLDPNGSKLGSVFTLLTSLSAGITTSPLGSVAAAMYTCAYVLFTSMGTARTRTDPRRSCRWFSISPARCVALTDDVLTRRMTCTLPARCGAGVVATGAAVPFEGGGGAGACGLTGTGAIDGGSGVAPGAAVPCGGGTGASDLTGTGAIDGDSGVIDGVQFGSRNQVRRRPPAAAVTFDRYGELVLTHSPRLLTY